MGLAADLGYAIPTSNALQRLVQTVASTRRGAWFFSRTLTTLDSTVARWSRGRVSLPLVLAGLPVVVLTSTGRRSGKPRQTRLIAVPFQDTLALLGTNFGQPRTPAWVLNLEAEPTAAVTCRGVSRNVVARPATESERAQVLTGSAAVYAGYRKYQQRITGRRLRIFVLEAG